MNKFEDYLQKNQEIGRIDSINNYIIRVSGLPNLKPDETIITEQGQKGITYNLGDELAEILMLESKNLQTKTKVARTGEYFKIGVNSNLIGRIINPLGRPIDGQGPITGQKSERKLKGEAPNITERKVVKRNLKTGVTKVDLLIPLGYGQRELVLGEEKVGKTSFLLQTMAKQARQGTICIYVSIGNRASNLKAAENYFAKMEVLDDIIIMRAGAGAPSPLQYIAPLAGMSIAEYFRNKGEDALVVFDDLTTHAKTYRELSLLLGRTPGRSSYPGDIFHIHAALLERAGNVESEDVKGSITALPVATTSGNNISGYIQTNLMAITDGHLFLDNELFRKGVHPAINTFLSVSRVGNQTKPNLDRDLAQLIREKMSAYNRALEIARFGVELPEETRDTLSFGKKLEKIFTQPTQALFSREFQLLLVGLLVAGYWDEKSPEEVESELPNLVERYQQGELEEIETQIKDTKKLEEFKSLIKEITPKIES